MIDEELRTAVHRAYERATSEAPPTTVDVPRVMGGVRRRRAQRRTGLLVAAAVGAVALTGVVTQWADKDDPPTAKEAQVAEPVDPQPSTFQVPLPPGVTLDEVIRDGKVADTVATIEAEVKGIPGSAGFAVDADTLAVMVHWKAPVPQVVMDAARLAEPGVTVTVIPAPWSLADAFAAADRLIAAAEKGTIPAPGSMTLSNDAQTLRVGMTPLDANGQPVALPTEAELQAIAGMPVTRFNEGETVALGG